ncbi:MAG: DUF1697 domain-containing protein [Bacteroidota bacterium]
METYIILLKGVNVGGNNRIKMAEFREHLQKKGFKNVKTYIQSGNIVLSHNASLDEVKKRVVEVLSLDYGYNVSVLVFTLKQFEHILAKCPYDAPENDKKVYFSFLEEVPDTSLLEEFQSISFPDELFQIGEQCIYLLFQSGYSKANMSNTFIIKKLKVAASTRNLKTVRKILELAKT